MGRSKPRDEGSRPHGAPPRDDGLGRPPAAGRSTSRDGGLGSPLADDALPQLAGDAMPTFGLGELESQEHDEPHIHPRSISLPNNANQQGALQTGGLSPSKSPRSPRNKIPGASGIWSREAPDASRLASRGSCSSSGLSPPKEGSLQDIRACLSELLQEHTRELRELIREEIAQINVRSPARKSTTASHEPVSLEASNPDASEQAPGRGPSYINGDHEFATEEQRHRFEALERDETGAWSDSDAPLDNAKSLVQVVANKGPCLRNFLRWTQATINVLGMSFPKREDCVARIADSPQFHMFVYSIIFLNVAFMVYSANYEVSHYSRGELYRGDIIATIERVFLVIYSVELLLQLWRDGRYFLINVEWKWNWLDTALVLVSYYLYFVEDMLPNVSWLRLLRLLKLAKVLRVFRVVAMFTILRAILQSLISTFSTLFWSLIMLYLIIFAFALSFTLLTGDYLSDQASVDPDVQEELVQYFGTVHRSTISLYMCITGGNDWSLFYNALKPTGSIAHNLLILYIFFTQVAVMNIILGMFVNQAIDSMKPSREEAAAQHMEDMRRRDKDLVDIIKLADIAGNGVISIEEWRATLRKGNVAGYLDLCGFRPADLQEYYKMMCKETEDGNVDLDRFVQGCLSLRGRASKFDMHVLHCELKELSRLVHTQLNGGIA